MAQSTRPPDLDANGQPVGTNRPPDLDATGVPAAQASAAPKTPPPSAWQRMLGTMADSQQLERDAALPTARAEVDMLKGVGKGGVSTLIGAGDLASRFPLVQQGIEKATGRPFDTNVFQRARERFATPTNESQKAGFLVEQIGENFTASGAGEKLAATIAEHLIAQGVPKAAATLAVKTAVNSAVNASTTAVQGGDVKTAAEIGASLPVVGSLVSAAGRTVGAQAPKLVRSALKPTVTAMKQTAGASRVGINAQADRLVKFVLDNGITSAAKAEQIIVDAERDIQAALANAPAGTMTDAPQRAARYLDALKRSAAKQGLPADDVAVIENKARELLQSSPLSEDVTKTVTRTTPFGTRMAGGPATEQAQQTTRALRTDVSPTEALTTARSSSQWGNKKQWGEQKGAATEASKAVERATRDSVKAAVPETVPLFQRQGQGIQTKSVFDRMQFREGNREPISPFDVVTAAAETSQGGLPIMAMARHFLWNNKIRLGIWAKRLDDAIARNDVQEASGIMARFGAAGVEASVPEPVRTQ